MGAIFEGVILAWPATHFVKAADKNATVFEHCINFISQLLGLFNGEVFKNGIGYYGIKTASLLLQLRSISDVEGNLQVFLRSPGIGKIDSLSGDIDAHDLKPLSSQVDRQPA